MASVSLRVVCSDAAAPHLRDAASTQRPPTGKSVPVPKAMTLMGCEAIEASEVSALAGRDNSSASKAMAKFGVNFWQDDSNVKRRRGRSNSLPGRCRPPQGLCDVELPRRRSINGPKQTELMGPEAHDAYAVAATIAATITRPSRELIRSNGDVEDGALADVDELSPHLHRVPSSVKVAKAMELMGVAYPGREEDEREERSRTLFKRRLSAPPRTVGGEKPANIRPTKPRPRSDSLPCVVPRRPSLREFQVMMGAGVRPSKKSMRLFENGCPIKEIAVLHDTENTPMLNDTESSHSPEAGRETDEDSDRDSSTSHAASTRSLRLLSDVPPESTPDAANSEIAALLRNSLSSDTADTEACPLTSSSSSMASRIAHRRLNRTNLVTGGL
mmetsp:Transcript_25077/g.57362  ORF Transcript_25077/g.57362 Transcript_25077/m.57362 type:complete len:387 (+) Transcript_25077:83-1243(+)